MTTHFPTYKQAIAFAREHGLGLRFDTVAGRWACYTRLINRLNKGV